MKEFYYFVLNFCLEYWYLCLAAAELLSVIVYFIVSLIFKKKNKPVKVVDILTTVILRLLPSLIREAETTGLKGQDKLKWVLDELQKLLKSLDYGDDIIAQYLPFAANQVEVILSTPQKKGVKR